MYYVNQKCRPINPTWLDRCNIFPYFLKGGVAGPPDGLDPRPAQGGRAGALSMMHFLGCVSHRAKINVDNTDDTSSLFDFKEISKTLDFTLMMMLVPVILT